MMSPKEGETKPAGDGLEKDPAVDTTETRENAYVFKAGSSLPDERVESLEKDQLFLVRYRDECYVMSFAAVSGAFPELAEQHASQPGTIDLRNTLTLRAAYTQNATPELIRSVGTTNIVRYDGEYYLIPQSLGSVRLGQEDVAGLPGVVVAYNLRDAIAIAQEEVPQPEIRSESEEPSRTEEQERAGSVPKLRRAVGNYNIVDYEGWYYGIPQSLGPIDLSKVDVIEMPGVIRDLSADVVEREILELQS